MKRIRRFVCCWLIIIMTSITFAYSDTISWYPIESNRTILIRHEVNPHYPEYIVYKLLSDGKNLYLRNSKSENTILLNNFDLQYQSLSDSINFSDSAGIWYISSDSIDRATKAYEEGSSEQFDYTSDYVLIENSGTTFKYDFSSSEDSITYTLKTEYQPEKLCINEVDFGIAVIVNEEDIPRFWINLSNDECNIKNSDNGIEVYVSKLVIENAIKSYQNLLKNS